MYSIVTGIMRKQCRSNTGGAGLAPALPYKYPREMPLMHSWIFRRGQQPVLCHNIDLEKLEIDKKYVKPKFTEEMREYEQF